MMETTITKVVDDELIEDLQKVLETYRGKLVKIEIRESNGDEKKRRR